MDRDEREYGANIEGTTTEADSGTSDVIATPGTGLRLTITHVTVSWSYILVP